MRYMSRIAAFIVAALMLAMLPNRASAADERCFPETGQCIGGRFREYWEQNGGLSVFGFPITPAREERNRDTGQTYLTQWFERNRFELHPENAAPYDVLLGRLSDERLRLMGVDWQVQPREGGPKAGCLWFETTGHNVCDQLPGVGFKTYWRTHGLHDPHLDAYGRSLALLGLPLTEATTQVSPWDGKVYLIQWFERARFEWHPDERDEYKVLLGLLGNEVRMNTADAPEKGRIAFARDGDVYLMSAGGGSVRRLTQQPRQPAGTTQVMPEPVWSPDGSWIAYMGYDWNPYVISLDGGQQVRLSENQLKIYLRPAWSPDGQRIAFERSRDIYVVNANGGEPINLTNTESQAEYGADWSPDGKQIAFVRDGNLYLMNPGGNNQQQLTSDLRDVSAPRWSPDNVHIVFTAYPQRGNGDVYVINADGSGLANLTDSEGINDSAPIWSPDGGRIAFESNRDPEAAEEEIYVMKADGSQPTRLTNNDAIDTSISWSPDGKQIAFASNRGGSFGVYAMRADGAEQIFLATGEAPAWSSR
jgi:Tol biopolymer transport system component